MAFRIDPDLKVKLKQKAQQMAVSEGWIINQCLQTLLDNNLSGLVESSQKSIAMQYRKGV